MTNDGATGRGFGRAGLVAAVAAAVVAISVARADDDGWIELIDSDGFAAWKPPTEAWAHATAVRIDAKKSTRLGFDAGPGPIIVNGPTGRTRNLVTTRSFGDVELHAEFFVPKGSNSGIKLEGVYEIQIADSHGVATPTASHTGGIYPRSEMKPVYHHIDKGYPPKLNAAKPAGEWQTLDITFRAPKFDASGKKVVNARFVKVVLNGQVVQDDVEMPYPTGDNWSKPEHPEGPILLQADHGPVAFRSVRARPLR
jgi:hypothetical protein